jgi:hypothetical protein
MKQLDRLLFVQGGECFFCRTPLSKADASVEHLLATANGGTNAEDNCVVCCKTLNALLGSKSLKAKLEVFLRQKGPFRCPALASEAAVVRTAAPPSKLGSGARRVVAKTAVASAPLTVVGVKRSGSAHLHSPPSRSGVMCPTCKHTVPVAVGQVDHVCPHCGGAFRY